MNVLLVRHAQAVSPELAPSDSLRWLTAEGRRTMRGVAARIRDEGVTLTRIFTSPLVRAAQTAEILASPQDAAVEVEVWPPLAGGTTAQALAALDRVQDGATVALVGHEPAMRAMAARVTGHGDFPGFRTAGACLTRWEGDRGELVWLLDPRTLTRIEDIGGYEP